MPSLPFYQSWVSPADSSPASLSSCRCATGPPPWRQETLLLPRRDTITAGPPPGRSRTPTITTTTTLPAVSAHPLSPSPRHRCEQLYYAVAIGDVELPALRRRLWRHYIPLVQRWHMVPLQHRYGVGILLLLPGYNIKMAECAYPRCGKTASSSQSLRGCLPPFPDLPCVFCP